MKVKIGDMVFDGENTPVMVMLTEKDRESIASMASRQVGYYCYCQYPDGLTEDDVKKFMYWSE